MVYSFCSFEASLPIACPINPCKYFPVACVISQIIFKFCLFFFNIDACVNNAGLC